MPGLRTIFVLGKGGTGKSTAAALMALASASRKQKTVLASLDDAHNQSDIFQQSFSHRPVSVTPWLDVIQVDRDREIGRYLKTAAGRVKQNFSYLTAFNLDHYFDVLKLSPGMEEYALVTAYESLARQYRDHDYLIADMPPTALSLRFFNLPALSLAWIGQLEALRMEIRKKKEVISTIRVGGKTLERDKILSGIREIKAGYEGTLDRFRDPDKARVVAVSNPDVLAASETARIHDQLAALGIKVKAEVMNRRMPGPAVPAEKGNPSDPMIQAIPFSDVPLIGRDCLVRFAADHGLTFDTVFGG